MKKIPLSFKMYKAGSITYAVWLINMCAGNPELTTNTIERISFTPNQLAGQYAAQAVHIERLSGEGDELELKLNSLLALGANFNFTAAMEHGCAICGDWMAQDHVCHVCENWTHEHRE